VIKFFALSLEKWCWLDELIDVGGPHHQLSSAQSARHQPARSKHARPNHFPSPSDWEAPAEGLLLEAEWQASLIHRKVSKKGENARQTETVKTKTI